MAPNGSRVNLPNDEHDAIATYDLTFEQPGTYRAYYRARGFNGSTDSIYVPDDFATDPDSQENLASDGEFRWEVGQTFTISASEVGVPLEFRIGKREEASELDAFVLDLDLSLNASELDALFDVVIEPEDFNEDGTVDGSDLLAWQEGFGTTSGAVHTDGDADEDGDVDGFDFLAWQRGLTPKAAVSSIAVPEPSSVTLMFLSLTVLCRVRSFNRKS